MRVLPKHTAAAAIALCLASVSACGHDTPSGGESPRDASAGGGTGALDAGPRVDATHLPVLPPSALPCNTWPALCDRPYDSVMFPATHASMENASPPWRYPAQRRTLRQQLDDSIRAIQFEVHELDGVLVVCRDACGDGSTPLASALGQLAGFFDDNPREVVTLFVENHVAAKAVEGALEDAKLSSLLLAHAAGDAWPTLGKMIENGTRLVVFVDDAAGASPALLSAETHLWSTRPDFHDKAAMTCAPLRGGADARLGLLQNFLTVPLASDAGSGAEPDSGSRAATLAAPDPTLAEQVNDKQFVIDRARGCEVLHGKLPSFIAVDFYDVGDVVGAVQVLSRLAP